MSSDPPKPMVVPAGWNDPPVFTYEAQLHGVQASRLNLTKRVSFPNSSSAGSPIHRPNSSAAPPVGQDCPPPSSTSPPSVFSQPDLSSSDCNLPSSRQDLPSESLTSDISFQQISDNLESQILIASKDSERTASDLRRRIKTLERMWSEDKISPPLKLKILKLTEAVKDGHVDLGRDLQRSLMVDHAQLCSSWIPAVRHLLNRLDPSENFQAQS